MNDRISYYNANIKSDRKALKEVWVLLQDEELIDEIKEIPEKYLWVIENNMDKGYEYDINDPLSEDAKK